MTRFSRCIFFYGDCGHNFFYVLEGCVYILRRYLTISNCGIITRNVLFYGTHQGMYLFLGIYVLKMTHVYFTIY